MPADDCQKRVYAEAPVKPMSPPKNNGCGVTCELLGKDGGDLETD